MDDLEEKIAYVLKCVEKYQSGEEIGEAKQPEFPFGETAKEAEEETGEENTEVIGDIVNSENGEEAEDHFD